MLNDILDRVTGLLGTIAPVGKERRDLKDQALRSISTALTETYLYYRDLEAGAMRNADTESMLAKYWSAAAIPLRHFDRDLAERCQYKSEYWINPETYSQKQVKALGIRLEDVKQAYHLMLRPWSLASRLRLERAPDKPAKKIATKGKKR